MARSTAKKASKPVPTLGVPITAPAFVPEHDAEGIVMNDPDSPYGDPAARKWKRRDPNGPLRPLPPSTLRRSAELTQVEVAARMQVSQTEVSRIESATEAADDKMQISTLRAYAKAIGYDVEIWFAKTGFRRRVM